MIKKIILKNLAAVIASAGIVGASAGYVIVDAITPEKSSNQKSNESEPGIH